MHDSDKNPQPTPASMSGVSDLPKPIVPDVVVTPARVNSTEATGLLDDALAATTRHRRSSWDNQSSLNAAQFALGLPDKHKGPNPSHFHG